MGNTCGFSKAGVNCVHITKNYFFNIDDLLGKQNFESFFEIYAKQMSLIANFPNNCNTRLCDIFHFFKKIAILHFAILSISSKS